MAPFLARTTSDSFVIHVRDAFRLMFLLSSAKRSPVIPQCSFDAKAGLRSYFCLLYVEANAKMPNATFIVEVYLT